MVEGADVITMDSLLNNPDFDFMKQYNNRDDDNDNNTDNPSPYDNIVNSCNYYDLPYLIFIRPSKIIRFC